jgi:hypothetical protein
MDELGTIDCPACGKPIPLASHGRKIIARHDCLGLPLRDVYESTPPTQAELDRAAAHDLVVGDEVAPIKKGKTK